MTAMISIIISICRRRRGRWNGLSGMRSMQLMIMIIMIRRGRISDNVIVVAGST